MAANLGLWSIVNLLGGLGGQGHCKRTLVIAAFLAAEDAAHHSLLHINISCIFPFIALCVYFGNWRWFIAVLPLDLMGVGSLQLRLHLFAGSAGS